MSIKSIDVDIKDYEDLDYYVINEMYFPEIPEYIQNKDKWELTDDFVKILKELQNHRDVYEVQSLIHKASAESAILPLERSELYRFLNERKEILETE